MRISELTKKNILLTKYIFSRLFGVSKQVSNISNIDMSYLYHCKAYFHFGGAENLLSTDMVLFPQLQNIYRPEFSSNASTESADIGFKTITGTNCD